MDIPSYTPEEANKLPELPGVYKYFNENSQLIYVGKAKSLKKRVSSYFNKSTGLNFKTRKMVREVRRIEVTIVDSESDALHLENSLIKQYQPKYNILLKDDKTFPYICVTNERFPRIISTRRVIQGAGAYYGPYSSVRAMNNILTLIRSLYQLRTCKYNLSEENIRSGKFKVCLEYHIKNCQGPCEGLQAETEYLRDIEQAVSILKGKLGIPRNYFHNKMALHAEKLEFEKAEYFKTKLLLLDKFQAKTVVVNQKIEDADVFTLVADEKTAYVNFLKVIHGAIVQTLTIEVKKRLDEEPEDILPILIVELRKRFNSQSKEVITHIELGESIDGASILIPKIGDKRKLIEMSLKNALFYKKEKLNQVKEKREDRVLRSLRQELNLQQTPRHIECFDNSNIQGTNPVASMVCFKNGKPAKKEYRHYNIKTVTGPDDFASMNEVVGRRYKRLTEEAKDLPNLIVIDGGKGQLNAACDALQELGLYGKIPIIGIAKRLEEIYFPEDPYPLHIDKKSEALMLIQRIRDEAHRFAITFHRQKRSNATFTNQLEEIEGIGPGTAKKLYQQIGPISKIKMASLPELSAIIGENKALKVIRALQPETKKET